jgi:hypothetical protein
MQGHSGAAARNSAPGRGGKSLRLLVNPPRLQLDDRTVIFKYTGDGGWFCASFGDGAKYMRATKEDAVLRRRIEARARHIRRNRDALGPDLARVMAAVELAKDYDPDQARDEQGRWTSGGGSASAAIAGAVADAARMFGNPAYAEGLRQLAARALAAVPAAAAVGEVTAAAAPAAAFFGTLFIPAPRNVTSDGTLPDAPDFSYHFDQEAGHLTITHQLADGTRETVFDGRYDKDGVFRDADGNAIGRHLGSSVALDADAVRGYEARRRSDAQALPDAIAQSIARTRSDPEVCPEPGPDKPGRKDPGAIAYQMYVQQTVNGAPLGIGLAIKMTRPNGEPTYFDDCDHTKEMGALIDAKGFGYLRLLQQGEDRYPWLGALQKLIDQSGRQIEAAQGRPIRWYFSEPQVGVAVRRVFERLEIPIRIVDLPPPKGLIGDLKRIFEGSVA